MFLVFMFFLIVAICTALSAAGVDFTQLAHVKWLRIFKVFITIVLAVACCYFFSWFGLVPGVIGLVGGIILGALLPTIIGFAWRVATWWMKTLFVLIVIAGIVAAIFYGG